MAESAPADALGDGGLQALRERLVDALAQASGCRVQSLFAPPEEDGVDVWWRTPNGFRVATTLAAWSPAADGLADAAAPVRRERG